jgi:transposase
MTNDINFLTGIQDLDLQVDKGGTEMVDDKIKVIHLVKTGKCLCPICGRPMLKNGFRHRPVVVTALAVAGMKTVLMIRKQKYICKSSAQCPRIVTEVASIHGIRRGCRIAKLPVDHGWPSG